MKVEFPARARCIEGNAFWRRGEEVRVLRMLGVNLCVIEGDLCELIGHVRNFKPIIRVRA